ncbi:4Fe-4S binding protein [Breoghania sp.]|uniref:4Fe-4S binding protein n=1 Tax=Breoghania sp. TaxID=2065378 RepID=UPI002629465A|nr:4Fe-4S binding protein [Breoghania sp.]MDJ0932703.1 4Fe-4S binding protein [Breoghania sp.]
MFSQFVFWGIWWPGVLLSTVLFGRLWCGTMCPKGALLEFASKHRRKRSVPRWVRCGRVGPSSPSCAPRSTDS